MSARKRLSTRLLRSFCHQKAPSCRCWLGWGLRKLLSFIKLKFSRDSLFIPLSSFKKPSQQWMELQGARMNWKMLPRQSYVGAKMKLWFMNAFHLGSRVKKLTFNGLLKATSFIHNDRGTSMKRRINKPIKQSIMPLQGWKDHVINVTSRSFPDFLSNWDKFS